ncbi:MAG TPA: hypothetical protein VMG08_18115 [Allosphingosinicella sp.]|nr:hypothetical protein [Allosphingosinicella sp.]
MTFAALAFTVLGATLLYLQAPRQAWRRTPLPTAPTRLAGIVSLLIGLLVWQTMTSPVTGFFIQLTLLMLAFALFPYLALLRPRRG